jgi:hypothetical protein
MPTPEERARENIDKQLVACGWIVQSRGAVNLYAGRGVAVREFPLETGEADYLLFVDRKAVGVWRRSPNLMRGLARDCNHLQSKLGDLHGSNHAPAHWTVSKRNL